MRERLIKKINTIEFDYGEILAEYAELEYRIPPDYAEYVTDRLLAEGIIVLPCKVGQTVYVVSRYYGGLWQIHECRVDSLTIYEKHIFMSLVDREYNFGMEVSEIGKTVFFTKKEAERALKGEGQN